MIKNIKTKGLLINFFDGTILTKDIVVKQLPFIIFLSVLAVIYIGNRYNAEKVIREISAVQKELKELRTKSISIASELMYISKQSEVVKAVNERGLGLTETTIPPKKIYIPDANKK